MLRALPYFSPYVVLTSFVFFCSLGGWGFYFSLLFIAVLDPILDRIFGKVDIKQSMPEDKPNHFIYDMAIYLWIPVQILYILWGFALIIDGNLSAFEFVGLTISIGLLTGGLGINVAHELIHRRKPWERALGVILLNTVTYGHWRLEHVYGHHKLVATPEDPASAQLGENLYGFWFRCLMGTISSAWKIERERLRKKGKTLLSAENRLLHYAVIETTLYIAAFIFAGWLGLIFFAAQSFIGVLMLETINYIEHYGLQRKKIAEDRYEPYSVRHSWDQPFRKTNWCLVNLGYHALHHKSASIKYEDLHLSEESPKQPWGYSTLILMALFPPLWKKMVDPLVPHDRLEYEQKVSA
jgi:alkane 1-monooxygenase